MALPNPFNKYAPLIINNFWHPEFFTRGGHVVYYWGEGIIPKGSFISQKLKHPNLAAWICVPLGWANWESIEEVRDSLVVVVAAAVVTAVAAVARKRVAIIVHSSSPSATPSSPVSSSSLQPLTEAFTSSPSSLSSSPPSTRTCASLSSWTWSPSSTKHDTNANGRWAASPRKREALEKVRPQVLTCGWWMKYCKIGLQWCNSGLKV